MQRKIHQTDPEIGFTWVESEDEYYLRNPAGDLKRLSDDGLTLLRELANGSVTSEELPNTAKQLVGRLKTEHYLRPGTPVVELIPPDDIRLWPRGLLFLGLVAGGVSISLLELPVSFSRTDLLTPRRIVLFGVLMLVTIVIHESGHYLASKPHFDPTVRLGTVNGIIPAVITETTGAWMLPRNRRLRIHLAGPFVHLIWLHSVFVIHQLYFPGNIVLTVFILSSLANIVFSFNPLIHGDGYWFLLDSFNVIDLRRRGINDVRNRELTFAAGYVLASYTYAVLVLLSVVSIAYLFTPLGHV